MVQAFVHTGIAVTVTIPNDQIPHFTMLSYAQQWLRTNIKPYFPSTDLVRILVGNEVLSIANRLLIASLAYSQHQTLHQPENFDKAMIDTNSRILINPYHFFGCPADTLDYALFRPNAGMVDENTNLFYPNMLNA
ncbi:hypothetical protein RJ641_007762 [Dillenia turbinata]|uniref:Glucan endo-1,3-beta-D-glucosidase n=1 Tax=Dillenia turbinata TaxID=194707 RepID=A0AAN8ZA47_9MAGN